MAVSPALKLSFRLKRLWDGLALRRSFWEKEKTK
jgi:hypothetical protein